MRSPLLFTPLDLLWTAIGFILMLVGTLLRLSVPNTSPFLAGYDFNCQVGGLLLTACLGGPTAAMYAQIIYLAMGLSGLQIFSYGGDLSYLNKPSFGYLLGFPFAAWICGTIAFWRLADSPKASRTRALARIKAPIELVNEGKSDPLPRLISALDLTKACLSGLGVIHIIGITYLLVRNHWDARLFDLIGRYSGYPLIGQLFVGSAVILVALVYRRLTFY